MDLKPIGENVLVELLESAEKSRGGIIVPDAAKEKPQEAKVVAVGAGKTLGNGKLIPPHVKAGDKIVFSKYSGSEIKLDGREFLIINEDDILALIK